MEKMSIDVFQIAYDWIFNYQIHSSFAAFLRVSVVSYFTFWVLFASHEIKVWSQPEGVFGIKTFMSSQVSGGVPLACFTFFEYIKNSKILRKCFFALFYLSSILAISGLITNISLAIFTLCFISIQHRIYPVFMNNGNTIEKILLIFLTFVDCGSRYSLDEYFKISSNLDFVDGWGVRMIQISLPVIYFLSVQYKGEDLAWVRGGVLKMCVMSNAIMRSTGKYLYPYLIHSNRWILRAATKTALWFEYFAIPLFIFDATRPIALGYFMLMHFLILIFFKIDHFGSTMMIALLFYLNEYFLRI